MEEFICSVEFLRGPAELVARVSSEAGGVREYSEPVGRVCDRSGHQRPPRGVRVRPGGVVRGRARGIRSQGKGYRIEGGSVTEKSTSAKPPVSRAVESAFTKVWGDDHVVALIALKVETAEADTVASEVARFTEVEDVFLVTGDTDIFLKVRFPHYDELKDFVLHRLPSVRGIRETKTLLVVTAYKEGGETRHG